MKRKGTFVEPHSARRKDRLKARHTQKAKRAFGSTISGKQFEHTRQARKATKRAQKRNRRK